MYLPITSIVHPFSSSSVVLVLDLDGVWQWEPKHMFRSVKSFYMHTSRFYLLTLRVSDGERPGKNPFDYAQCSSGCSQVQKLFNILYVIVALVATRLGFQLASRCSFSTGRVLVYLFGQPDYLTYSR